jgi:radical S-adenosyl methionine domain-containing protein 2
MPIETVNLHVWGKCNLACLYCYGTFPQRPRSLSREAWEKILDILRDAGVRRVTFSGGEPALHPELLGMLSHAHDVGLQTAIITNGTHLTDAMLARLDLVGITLDSARDEVLTALGRKPRDCASYLALVRDLCFRTHQAGVRLKINTVVTTHNAYEDLTDELLRLGPAKWKPLQFVHVPGENDALSPHLSIDAPTFASFVARHARLAQAGILVAPETDQTVRSTYVMVDPAGRVFQHGPDGHVLSQPILEVGVVRAIEQAGGYDRQAFEARGGHINIKHLPVLNSRKP